MVGLSRQNVVLTELLSRHKAAPETSRKLEVEVLGQLVDAG
jgi:hypothetical protein